MGGGGGGRVVSEVAARLTTLFEREKSGGCDDKDQGRCRQTRRSIESKARRRRRGKGYEGQIRIKILNEAVQINLSRKKVFVVRACVHTGT